MKYYLEQVEAVFAHVKSSADGLTTGQAESRLAENGKNKLQEAKKDSLLKRFFQQMMDPMIIILLVAAAISAALVIYEGMQAGHFEFPTDVIIILAVVLINAVLGVYQENKADKAIEALHEMAAATSKVLRDGKVCHVKSEDLVVGDVVLLEAGDAVPADCRVIENASMKIEEAALTGESVPVSKMLDALTGGDKNEVALGDRKNMVYMGSTVVYGRGKAVVVGTGMQTEMGKIAGAIALAEEGQTPLQLKLTQLSKYLTILVIGVCIFVFALSIVRQYFSPHAIDFAFILDTFMIAVSLAVAAIPEGLAAVVTVVLSIGVTNMAKKNAIIRKLTAVETLGCAQIICSDKTGTLTQNKMTVTDHFGSDEALLAKAMALCTDVNVDADGNVTGEPTEAALVNYALALNMNKNDLNEETPRVGEAPFDSGRKMMSTVHAVYTVADAASGEKQASGFVQYTKGAPDVVLGNCTKAIVNGSVVELTDALREEIMADNKRMADNALRVLAVSYRAHEQMPASLEPADLEKDLVFIGLTGMIDPVRPEVKASIEECRVAGITPIMITGDHKDTAVAIAKELGILVDGKHAITGAQLDEIDDATFTKTVDQYCVYARVQPEHKTRIVNAWRANGMVVAMTGDGVNDAPSIKNADIGVGMGITGTDVTKNVADMVLADDNFATIVSAVGEGRRIYDNIRKTIQFLLGSNLSEVLAILTATMLDFKILLPVHLLWINLITDCFPALALGMEKPERDIMRRRPRDPKAGVFSDGLGIDALYQGIIVTILTVTAFFAGEFMQLWNDMVANGTFAGFASVFAKMHFTGISVEAGREGMSMAFLTMAMCEIFHSFNMRSQRGSMLKMEFTGSHNKYLYWATAASLLLTSVVVLYEPIATAFKFDTINLQEYGVAMALAFTIIPIVEIVKLCQRANTKRKAK